MKTPPATFTTTVPEALMAAADLIEQHGLAQDMFLSADGRYCAWGAINKAVTGIADDALNPLSGEAVSRLQKFLDRVEPHDVRSVTVWNDAYGRTADEVIEALRDAASAAESEMAL